MGFFAALLVTLFFGGYTPVPVGWGWDGDRPLDSLSAPERVRTRSAMRSVLGDLHCKNFVCTRPPMRRPWGQRSWGMDRATNWAPLNEGLDSKLRLISRQQHERLVELQYDPEEPYYPGDRGISRLNNHRERTAADPSGWRPCRCRPPVSGRRRVRWGGWGPTGQPRRLAEPHAGWA